MHCIASTVTSYLAFTIKVGPRTLAAAQVRVCPMALQLAAELPHIDYYYYCHFSWEVHRSILCLPPHKL